MSYILDSTLRDGAYAFGNAMPLNYVSHIGKNLDGLVDFIEVGSSISFGYGSNKAISEDIARLNCLNELLKVSKSVIFLQPSLLKNPKEDLKNIIEAKPSVIRLGIDPEIKKSFESDINLIIDNKNISFCLNLMKAYKYSETQFQEIINLANNSSNCLSINIVDSSGCMQEEEVFSIAKKIFRSAKTNIGVHIHNNIGLANKISCASILRGYYVDSTLLGKGRMGGNADTILLILFRALSITGDIKKIDKLIEKLFDCTSLIWGNESRDHIISIMVGLTGMHSSQITSDLLSSLESLPNLTKMISTAWKNEQK